MKKILLTLVLCGITLMSHSQDASVEKSVFGIQTGVLGIWIHNESKFSNSLALRSEVGIDTGLYGSSNTTDFLLGIVIAFEPRWYYNIKKRESKSNRIDGNSGNFVAIKTSYHPDLIIATSNDAIGLVSDLTIVPTWGIRRNIGNHFNYEAGFGIGYIHYFKEKNVSVIDEADVAVNLHLRIGYRF